MTQGTQPRIKNAQQSMREKVIYVDGSPITAQQVTLFLLQHPDFLTDRSQLLESLGIAHVPEYPQTASLIERQAILLRKKNKQLSAHLNQLSESSQHHRRLFQAAQQLTLNLMDQVDPYILLSQFKAALLEEFGIQQVHFFFFKKHLLTSPDYNTVSLLALNKKLPHWKNIHTAHYGPWGLAEQRFLCPKEDHSTIAIAPFLLKNPLGFMALASDAKENLEISLLNYLGDLVGKFLSRLLALEEEENIPEFTEVLVGI